MSTKMNIAWPKKKKDYKSRLASSYLIRLNIAILTFTILFFIFSLRTTGRHHHNHNELSCSQSSMLKLGRLVNEPSSSWL